MPEPFLARARRLSALVLAVAVLGAMAVAFQVSFAAIIYQGDLAQFVDRGIALTLMGAAAMAVVGALTLGYRGTCCQPQDAPAIVISLAAASIAAGMADPASEQSFATVAALVAVTAAASGLAAWLLGRLRLGFVARFIPFPVLGGFLAATGYLLVMGALGISIGTPVKVWNLGVLLDPGNVVRWLPWAALAALVILLMRRVANPFVLPIATLAAGAGFYLVIAALGISLAEAKAQGLLLGPFSSGGFLPSLAGWRPLDVDWLALAAQAPSILTVVGLTSATALISASALEVVTRTRIDPDRDLRGIGLANLAAAACGGPAGYHVLSETLLARSMGSNGPANGFVIAAGCLVALAFGAAAISAVPVGSLALLVLVVGFSMLIDPLWDQRRSLPATDYAVVLIIPVVTAVFGFLWGVAVGLLAAALFFIMTFARIDLVRLETTVARMRSRIERPEAEQARLARAGREASVYVLAGYVFFGTAHRLVSRIEAALDRSPRPRFVLIDFQRVRGIDISAARAIARLDETCRAGAVALILTGLDARDARLISGQAAGPAPRDRPGPRGGARDRRDRPPRRNPGGRRRPGPPRRASQPPPGREHRRLLRGGVGPRRDRGHHPGRAVRFAPVPAVRRAARRGDAPGRRAADGRALPARRARRRDRPLCRGAADRQRRRRGPERVPAHRCGGARPHGARRPDPARRLPPDDRRRARSPPRPHHRAPRRRRDAGGLGSAPVTIASLAMVARHALVALVVGMMSVALNISVAAVIYQGPLGVFLDRAIAQALIGGVVMGIASALMFSYRGTICQPQIAMAGVLTVAAAGMAAGMADPASEPAFATIAALVIATAALTGLATWLLGSLRLGVVARFVPFPVLTGFLAATGYLLIVGGLGMALGRPLRLGNLDLLFDTGNPIRWAPWLLAALAICVLTRRLGRPIVFPLGLVLACGLFYVALALAGSGIDAAHEARLLLGPFGGESLLGALFDWQPLAFEGRALLAQTPSIAAAVGIAVVGTAMSASAFEIAFGCRIDPDRDLRAVGIANLASAAGGGPGGYHAMAQTILAHGLGATGPSAGWIVAAACALALTVGTPVISVLPVGVFATGVIVVGVNLLVGPLVDQRRGMPAADYLVVLIIPAVTAAFGFLWGVATGLLAAALFFVVTFARIDVVRLATSGARLRSRVERPDTEQARLAVLGREVSIYGLDGYIFFGTADRLAQRVEDALARSPPPDTSSSTSGGSGGSTPRRRGRWRASPTDAGAAASPSASPGSTTRASARSARSFRTPPARGSPAASKSRWSRWRKRCSPRTARRRLARAASSTSFAAAIRRAISPATARPPACPPAPRSSRRARRPTTSWSSAPAPCASRCRSTAPRRSPSRTAARARSWARSASTPARPARPAWSPSGRAKSSASTPARYSGWPGTSRPCWPTFTGSSPRSSRAASDARPRSSPTPRSSCAEAPPFDPFGPPAGVDATVPHSLRGFARRQIRARLPALGQARFRSKPATWVTDLTDDMGDRSFCRRGGPCRCRGGRPVSWTSARVSCWRWKPTRSRSQRCVGGSGSAGTRATSGCGGGRRRASPGSPTGRGRRGTTRRPWRRSCSRLALRSGASIRPGGRRR